MLVVAEVAVWELREGGDVGIVVFPAGGQGCVVYNVSPLLCVGGSRDRGGLCGVLFMRLWRCGESPCVSGPLGSGSQEGGSVVVCGLAEKERVCTD